MFAFSNYIGPCRWHCGDDGCIGIFDGGKKWRNEWRLSLFVRMENLKVGKAGHVFFREKSQTMSHSRISLLSCGHSAIGTSSVYFRTKFFFGASIKLSFLTRVASLTSIGQKRCQRKWQAYCSIGAALRRHVNITAETHLIISSLSYSNNIQALILF